MRSAIDLVEDLKKKYEGVISFKRICECENILVIKVKLGEGVNGFYATSNGHRVMVLNANLPHHERRDWAFHELYHHFRTAPGLGEHRTRRDEQNADTFAALCRAPVVREGDSDESLMERYGVCRRLARIRIQIEQRRVG